MSRSSRRGLLFKGRQSRTDWGGGGSSNFANKGLSTRARRSSLGAAIVTMQVYSNEEGPRATLKPGLRNKARHSTHTSQPNEKKESEILSLNAAPG